MKMVNLLATIEASERFYTVFSESKTRTLKLPGPGTKVISRQVAEFQVMMSCPKPKATSRDSGSFLPEGYGKFVAREKGNPMEIIYK